MLLICKQVCNAFWWDDPSKGYNFISLIDYPTTLSFFIFFFYFLFNYVSQFTWNEVELIILLNLLKIDPISQFTWNETEFLILLLNLLMIDSNSHLLEMKSSYWDGSSNRWSLSQPALISFLSILFLIYVPDKWEKKKSYKNYNKIHRYKQFLSDSAEILTHCRICKQSFWNIQWAHSQVLESKLVSPIWKLKINYNKILRYKQFQL